MSRLQPMKTMRDLTKYVLVLAFLLSAVSVFGNEDTFRTIDNKAGLCDNSINCIRQDKNGMMWFATWNGLCRYDGLLFYTFQHVFGDEGSITNNHVMTLEIGDHGLWASTYGGLEYLSFTTGRFSRCTLTAAGVGTPTRLNYIRSIVLNGRKVIVSDGEGNLYVGDSEENPDRFERSPVRQNITALCRYRGGKLLGVGPAGVYLLSADGRKVLGRLPRSIQVGLKTKAYFSRNSNLLYVGNGIGSSSMAFAISENRISEIPASVPQSVMDIVDYGRGTAFATDGNGVLLHDGGTLTAYNPQNSNICGDAIYAISTDKDGNLWVGSYRMGISMMPSRKPWWTVFNSNSGQLTYNIVTAVVPDGNKMYVGLDGGALNIIERNTGRLLRSVNAGSGALPGNNIVSMVKDDKYLYMAIYTSGFARMSLADGTFTNYHMPLRRGVNTDDVWTLCDDGLGRVWIGGPDVCVFDKASGRITDIKRLRGVSCSGMARHGNYIWLSSTHDGIYKLDRHTFKVLAHYNQSEKSPVRLPYGDVKYIYVARNGVIWFMSEASGFYSFDEKTGSLTRYGSAEGLTSHFVTSMTEDRYGSIWLGTLNGLFRLNPRTKMFVRFDEDTELPSCYTYNASCFYDGTVYIGSIGGLVSFNPARTSTGGAYGRVGFIALRLLNGSGYELPLFGSEPEGITLKHDQNFFTLSFTVPDMYAPGRTHFACRLEGLENGWRELAGRREVSYTNVPPGNYKFYVRCTDSTGRWTESSVLEITITPPWYATTLARIIWTMLVIGLVVAGAWLYLHEMAIKNEVRIGQIEKDAQRKLNEAKMNFYTNITHELRTPVFLITAQLEELLDTHKSILQVPSSYLQAMHRSARKLNSLVNRVIELRKLDSGVLKLNLVRRDVAAFCRNLVEDYEELCSQKDITFTFNAPQGELMLDFDPEKLEMILSNLVSNAFKYTKENGSVAMTLVDKADRVVFSVRDNGIGIIEKMRDTIFESFFRTERAERQSGGDGLGLSFVKQLVELHGGRISVDSEVNVGSTFTFFIPKRSEGTEPEQGVKTNEAGPKETQSEPVGGSNLLIQDMLLSGPERKDEAHGLAPANPAAAHSVLVIDDEHATVDLIERALCANYTVYKAYNGEEGLKVARQRMPDIVICDIMMPKMDGLTLLSVMKNDKTLKHIKVIIFTAKSSEEDMLKAYGSGADSYLTKPISLKVLRTRVDRLVAQGSDVLLTDAREGNGTKTYNKEERIFLVRCREIIDDNLSNADFSIDLMADKLAMSHSALYKRIKTITGMSLISFINDYKIYKAVQLFRQGVTSVDEVSEQCGFRDTKNFREMFKRKMNMTPKQFVLSL